MFACGKRDIAVLPHGRDIAPFHAAEILPRFAAEILPPSAAEILRLTPQKGGVPMLKALKQELFRLSRSLPLLLAALLYDRKYRPAAI